MFTYIFMCMHIFALGFCRYACIYIHLLICMHLFVCMFYVHIFVHACRHICFAGARVHACSCSPLEHSIFVSTRRACFSQSLQTAPLSSRACVPRRFFWSGSRISPFRSLGIVGSPSFQVGDTGPFCTPLLRLRNCGALSSVGGGDVISRSLSPLVGNSPALLGLADLPACLVHSISTECDSS